MSSCIFSSALVGNKADLQEDVLHCHGFSLTTRSKRDRGTAKEIGPKKCATAALKT